MTKREKTLKLLKEKIEALEKIQTELLDILNDKNGLNNNEINSVNEASFDIGVVIYNLERELQTLDGIIFIHYNDGK